MKKIMKLLTLSILVVMALSTTALAYIDPSVMTYVIQAVAGVVIAIGAAIAIYYHRIKKNIAEKLNIDENAKKEIEEDLIVFNEEANK